MDVAHLIIFRTAPSLRFRYLPVDRHLMAFVKSPYCFTVSNCAFHFGCLLARSTLDVPKVLDLPCSIEQVSMTFKDYVLNHIYSPTLLLLSHYVTAVSGLPDNY